MRIRPRLNRYERREMQSEKLKNDMAGSGIFIYQNNTNADLKLPKPTESGIRSVGPKKQFQGDSYFMKWVGSPMNLLRLVEVVVPQQKKGEIMNETKLILDQPDTITNQGKIEHVVTEQLPVISRKEEVAKQSEVLLTEDPLDGVEIILG